MATFIRVKLKLMGPLTKLPRADTLFGAMANAVSLIEGKKAVEELVDAFREGAGISSAFPYVGHSAYLPKPLTAELIDLGKDLTKMKKVKKATYLDLKNFERVLKLQPFEVPEGKMHIVADVPKVVLDRVTHDSSIYFWEEVRFREKSGLYFLYSGPDDVFRDFIEPAVRLLGDMGLGGKSTWGFGLFKPEFGRFSMKTPESPYSVTLSNTLPTKPPVLWRVVKKGGWSRGRRKPKMTFIAEGSVLKDDPGRFEKLSLGLPFDVYVYGLTFPVPTLLPEGLE